MLHPIKKLPNQVKRVVQDVFNAAIMPTENGTFPTGIQMSLGSDLVNGSIRSDGTGDPLKDYRRYARFFFKYKNLRKNRVLIGYGVDEKGEYSLSLPIFKNLVESDLAPYPPIGDPAFVAVQIIPGPELLCVTEPYGGLLNQEPPHSLKLPVLNECFIVLKGSLLDATQIVTT